MLFIADIALMKLPANKRFNMGPGRNVGTIEFNDVNTNDMLIQLCNQGTRVQISGWGKTETNDPSMRLKVGHSNFILETANMPDTTDPIDNRLLVGDARHGTWACMGDSGGKI